MKNYYKILFQIVVAQLIISSAWAQTFELICPGDVTVNCAELNYNFNFAYGKGYTLHNGYQQWQHDCKVVINLNDCGVGYVKRTWGVVNPLDFEWITCTQMITVIGQGAFTYDDITWPPSIEIRSCDPLGDYNRLGKPYDRPYWNTTKCAKPFFGFTDTKYRVSDGCEKIVREWKVLDWCIYDPYKNPYGGRYSSLQVIKLIKEDTASALLCQKLIEVNNDKDCDKIYVDIDTAVFITSCGLTAVIRNTSPFSDLKEDNASGDYPNGETKFYYIAEYSCGYEEKCEVIVRVKNIVPPTPYCLVGVTSTLMPVDADGDGIPEDGMIEIWASDLNKGSFHKCPGRNLTYSFSKDILDRSKVFTCKNLGENEVEIWVTDQFGNQDFCKTKVTVQNNNPNIPNCTDSVTIGGGTKKLVKAVGSPSEFNKGNDNVENSTLHERNVNSKNLEAWQIESIFPNPLGNSQHIYIQLKNPADGQANIELYTNLGTLVFKGNMDLKKGMQHITIPISFQASGLIHYIFKSKFGILSGNIMVR